MATPRIDPNDQAGEGKLDGIDVAVADQVEYRLAGAHRDAQVAVQDICHVVIELHQRGLVQVEFGADDGGRLC